MPTENRNAILSQKWNDILFYPIILAKVKNSNISDYGVKGKGYSHSML